MSSTRFAERGGVTTLPPASAALKSLDSRPQTITSQQQSRQQSQNLLRPSRHLNDVRTNASSSLSHSVTPSDIQDDVTPDSSTGFPTSGTASRDEILTDAMFSDWQHNDDTAAMEDPEEMQKKDPLGAQIWKLYSRTKTRLPNQERMENLTWRMMAMNLRKREREQQQQLQREQEQQQQQQQALYENTDKVFDTGVESGRSASKRASARVVSSAPSGIAQLRRSADLPVAQSSEPMNIDDFIVPTSMASPAGLTVPALAESGMTGSVTTQTGLPMGKTARPQYGVPAMPPQSMPKTMLNRGMNGEFDYVQRRVRKTSIDESKVSRRPSQDQADSVKLTLE